MEAVDNHLAIGRIQGPLIDASHHRLPPRVRTGICHACGTMLSRGSLGSICENCYSPQRWVRLPHVYTTCVSCTAAVEVPGNRCLTCKASRKINSATSRHAYALRSNVHPSPLAHASVGSPSLLPPYFNAHGQLVIPSHNVLRVCMRFGCGTRLPTDHVGETCEACVKAGLGCSYNRMVGSAARHAETTSCHRLPHECVDRAEDLEDTDTDTDLNLVYPEDAAEIAENTTSEAQAPAETTANEDADTELDLAYPDDAANFINEPTPNKSSSMAGPGLSRHVLLDQLKGTLVAIPPLGRANDTVSSAPAAATAERQCETSECDELLPRNSSLRRCVKCTVKHWKQRVHAATEAREKASLLRSSTKARKTEDTDVPDNKAGTSRPPEAKQAKLASLGRDQVSEEEEPSGNDEPPASSSSPTSHGISDTVDTLGSIQGWDSDLTDLSSTEDDDAGETVVESESEEKNLKIRIPLLVNHQPPDSPLRKCAYKRCNIALSKDYRWKTCEPCRRFQRAYQRARHNIKRRRLNSDYDVGDTTEDRGLCRRSPTPTPSELEVDETELTPENSRPCAIRYCQHLIPLPEVYRWKSCKKCRARARHEARRKKEALHAIKFPGEDHEPDAASPYPSYPAYQHSGALISSFSTRLEHFVEARILYLRTKLHSTGKSSLSKFNPMVFAFGGEYSTVVGQRGSMSLSPDIGMMRHEVHDVLEGLQGALRTMFKPSEAFALKTGGIIMRFTCSLELIAHLRPLQLDPLKGNSSSDDNVSKDDRGSPPSHTTLVKPMSGDLEVVIMPDNAHKLFLGHRAIISFRMLG